MNSRRELLLASILAISLALGLGTMSYALFSPSPPPTRLENALDVFTQNGGVGVNVSAGNFEPFDNVSVYAYLTQGGIRLENQSVTFDVKKPDGTQVTLAASTNALGVAETKLYLLPSEGHIIGVWRILAKATVDNEAVSDTLDFACKSLNAHIDVFSEKDGVPSISFLPSEVVFIKAQLSYRNASIAGTPVAFEVMVPNGTEFLQQTVNTDDLGTATISFQIPWPSDFSLGIWQISVESQVFEQTLRGTASFECELTPLTVDVFTQKGGLGQNTPGGYFTLNETVDLYAEVRNGLNQTMPNRLVTFAIIDPNGTSFAYFTQGTNSSGIATKQIRIPPVVAYVGTFEVYARTVYNDVVLLDTLTFIAEES
jgi:uncharacterized protein YfaS (alpha-2-macroglobulin family)